MTLLRQSGRYVAIGVMQLLLDWLVFVAATAAGLPAIPGNLLGRTSGALLGFWLIRARWGFPGEAIAQQIAPLQKPESASRCTNEKRRASPAVFVPSSNLHPISA